MQGAGSSHDADDLGIGGKAASCLVGKGKSIVDAELKDAAAGASQRHLRIRPSLADEFRRRTGARFIVSLAAVFDFDVHRLPVLCL